MPDHFYQGPRSKVTADTLGESNLLNVETPIKHLRLNHVHNIFYDLFPTYLKENFVPLKVVHQYCSRSSFLVPHCQIGINLQLPMQEFQIGILSLNV